MKQKYISSIAGMVAAAALWAGGGSCASGALVFDLGAIISSSGTPGDAPPWLRATITQDGANSVLIKMDALSLVTSPNIEAVKDWAFNLNPAILANQLTALEVDRVGSFNLKPVLALSPAKGYGGFAFDFDFAFATAGGKAATRFTDGDSVTMKITRAGGLTVEDFNYFATHGVRDFYSGAHIISLANNKSAFVGATTSIIESVPAVPEPATLIAGALLLLPFGVSTLRILRKKQTA